MDIPLIGDSSVDFLFLIFIFSIISHDSSEVLFIFLSNKKYLSINGQFNLLNYEAKNLFII